MKEWKQYRIGELVDLSQGQVINAQTNHLVVKEGIPLLRITDMINGTKSIFIDKVKVSQKNVAKPEDIIYTRTGQVGLVFKKQFGVVHNNCFKVIPKDANLDRIFLYWFLKTNAIYEYVNGVASGSAQPDLPHGAFKSITISLPPLPTQQRIASILSAYDDLIEVNNQRIKLLEETAREFYKEWFVRMRFPGYKKAKFVKGVPKGWGINTLDEFGKIYTGKTPSTKVPDYYGGDIPFIKTPDLHRSLFVFETEETLTEKGNKTQKRSTLPSDSICVSCIGTGGIVAITTAEKSQTNQQINSLIPSNKYQLEFLYHRIVDLKDTIELFGGTGATMTNLSKGKFEKLKILFPTKELVERYHKIVYPMFNQIKISQQQNTQLRQIRERLLPRLISGKLEVKEIKQRVAV